MTKKLELTDLDFPDHPKPWGAARCKAALKRNVGPHLATLGSAKQLGHQEKVTHPERNTVQPCPHSQA